MTAFDALLVLNQNADLSRAAATSARFSCRRVLVVTTHRLFEQERALLAGRFDEVRTLTFAECLDDALMERCDERASEELARDTANAGDGRSYARRFAERSTYHKNAAVHAALRGSFRWERIWFAPGLGVSARFWREQGGVRLGRAGLRERVPPTMPRAAHAVVDFLRFLIGGAPFLRLAVGAEEYVFASCRRLHFCRGQEPRPAEWSAVGKLMTVLRARSIEPAKLLRMKFGENVILAATIHHYPAYLRRDAGPVRIFVDGFHPSNYPRSYLDHYGAGAFVVTDPLSAEWFTRFGRDVVPAPAFLRAEPMVAPKAGTVETVLLALNHAGDWTALINRSDTDVLVERFCDAAARFPGLAFVVRPHPTMTDPAHEGRRSRRRLEAYVQLRNLPNLTVSDASLADDLERADLVVSEYSQVLIDALRSGKLGLIANFTGRRSFMADYEACGFSSVKDAEEFHELLSAIRDEPGRLVERQARAVAAYNERLARFLGWPEHGHRLAAR